MRVLGVTLGAAAGILTIGMAHAESNFVPETLTVEKTIKPGANVFVLDQNWMGPSRVNVLSADDLSHKGILSVGLISQMVLTKDHKTAYTASSYAKRIMSGPTEAVLQEFDINTLSQKREIPISNKLAQVAPYTSLLQLTTDEHYALVQNATPASSVTVVDLKSGKAISEIPTPGCWGIYPALKGNKFSSLCGDGAATTYTFEANGQFTPGKRSAKIFDVDADPLFIHAERVGKDLLFTSYSGSLYRVSDAGEAPKLKDKFSITKGIEGNWAPGGFKITAYNPAHDVLFVAMHPDAEDGSHKNEAEEIWAVDLDDKKVLYRSNAEGEISISVTAGKHPVLFGFGEEGQVQRYEVDPDAKFAAKLTDKVEDIGEFTLLGLTGE